MAGQRYLAYYRFGFGLRHIQDVSAPKAAMLIQSTLHHMFH